MLADRWIQGEGGEWQFVDPATGKVLGEVHPAQWHPGSWIFSSSHGSAGICGQRDLAMRFVEDVALMIGEAKTEETN